MPIYSFYVILPYIYNRMQEGECSRNNRKRRRNIMITRGHTIRQNVIPETCTTPAPQPTHQPHVTSSSTDEDKLDFGHPAHTCQYCGAIFWFTERIKCYSAHLCNGILCINCCCAFN
ncbi:hypothetical protein HS088_TW06G00170 [Tripterygium wilfordii]|uniref:Uncharacterized protein n=1 Tax=Tripterygium wilfordii TaxID=458696 RepID=A0A7J7DI15_TRIWF|nr:hypothetical protein HS088_TW06G00170 [Tripterygium wilfordii]